MWMEVDVDGRDSSQIRSWWQYLSQYAVERTVFGGGKARRGEERGGRGSASHAFPCSCLGGMVLVRGTCMCRPRIPTIHIRSMPTLCLNPSLNLPSPNPRHPIRACFSSSTNDPWLHPARARPSLFLPQSCDM